MAQAIVIVGGLGDDVDRRALLESLRQKTGAGIEWDWLQASECDGYNVPTKPFNRLLAKLTHRRDTAKWLRVVKLFRLHGRVVARLHTACADPVLVPKHIDSGPELVEWLLSAHANLVPRREWRANAEEAALVAILAKLIKNKSWNKDSQGHEWTKEADLLGQAPVSRPNCPEVRAEAAKMLSSLKGKLLLCKGGKQGKTPREWSIRLSVLTYVKRSMIDQSLGDLAKLSELKPIIERASKDENRCHRLDEEVITERVRQICRDRGI